MKTKKKKNIQNIVYNFINVEFRFAIDSKQRWRRKKNTKEAVIFKKDIEK